MTLTVFIGGARSGKTALAERAALAHAGPVLYLATGTATDDDMAARIARHRAGRDSRFETLEVGADLASALATHADRPALVDSLGTWLAHPDHLHLFDDDQLDDRLPAPGSGTARLDAIAEPIVAALRARTGPTVVVTEEVGLGVHPETAVGRRWRDALGELNQRVVAAADDAHLVVAGATLRLGPVS
jgi:adenosyl cobinamide kinase/adenosyl cobinamide phosphate guanylyltransferase